jgi:hypothetical protein
MKGKKGLEMTITANSHGNQSDDNIIETLDSKNSEADLKSFMIK